MVVSLFSFPISRRPCQEFLGWNGGNNANAHIHYWHKRLTEHKILCHFCWLRRLDATFLCMFLCEGGTIVDPISIHTRRLRSLCVVTGCPRGSLCHRCSMQYHSWALWLFCTFLATTVNAFVNLGGFLPPLSYLDSKFVQSSLLGWQAQSLYHCMDLGGMVGEGGKKTETNTTWS